jgi:hypothetical protein
MNFCNAFVVTAVVIGAIMAVVGEWKDQSNLGGYSSCDTSSVTDLDPKEADGPARLSENIKQLMEIYKGTVVWRKAYFLAICVTLFYMALSKSWSLGNFVLLLIIVFFFSTHAIMFCTFHSFLPISRIIKKNLDSLDRKCAAKP